MPHSVKSMMRQKARQQLPGLLAEYDHRCFWCRRLMVFADHIPPELFDHMTGSMVYWREPDGVKSLPFATVDHLIELSKGGTNKHDNIVPSCRPCNNRRSNRPRQFMARFKDHPYFQGQHLKWTKQLLISSAAMWPSPSAYSSATGCSLPTFLQRPSGTASTSASSPPASS